MPRSEREWKATSVSHSQLAIYVPHCHLLSFTFFVDPTNHFGPANTTLKLQMAPLFICAHIFRTWLNLLHQCVVQFACINSCNTTQKSVTGIHGTVEYYVLEIPEHNIRTTPQLTTFWKLSWLPRTSSFGILCEKDQQSFSKSRQCSLVKAASLSSFEKNDKLHVKRFLTCANHTREIFSASAPFSWPGVTPDLGGRAGTRCLDKTIKRGSSRRHKQFSGQTLHWPFTRKRWNIDQNQIRTEFWTRHLTVTLCVKRLSRSFLCNWRSQNHEKAHIPFQLPCQNRRIPGWAFCPRGGRSTRWTRTTTADLFPKPREPETRTKSNRLDFGRVFFCDEHWYLWLLLCTQFKKQTKSTEKLIREICSCASSLLFSETAICAIGLEFERPATELKNMMCHNFPLKPAETMSDSTLGKNFVSVACWCHAPSLKVYKETDGKDQLTMSAAPSRHSVWNRTCLSSCGRSLCPVYLTWSNKVWVWLIITPVLRHCKCQEAVKNVLEFRVENKQKCNLPLIPD